jgi:hypothetical protein
MTEHCAYTRRYAGRGVLGGPTTFSRGGVVVVRPGSASATVTGVSVMEGTVILATLQRREDGVRLHAVETNPAAGSFTIYLTAPPAAGLPVGWFAIG